MKTFILLLALLITASLTNSRAQDIWTQKTNFGGIEREGAVGFSIDSKGYIGTGGRSNPFLTVYQDFWQYDPVSDAWAQKTDFPGGPRREAVGFSIGNKGYLGTGWSNFSGIMEDFWEYDPESNIWTQKADYGGGERVSATGFSIGNKGYITTGYGDVFSFDFERDFWEYDPESDTWTQKNDFGGAGRYHAVSFSINNKGYVGTGEDWWWHLSDFWEYDPATDEWTQKSDAGGRQHAVGFSINNKGYIVCGAFWDDFEVFSSMIEYDPVVNTWTSKADFAGGARIGATGFSIGNKGFIGTGALYINYNYFYEYTNDFWEYSPTPCIPLTVYADADADGYGNLYDSYFSPDCMVPEGYVYDSTDCNDTDASVHALGNFYVDSDSDAYGAGTLLSICYSGVGTPAGYSINSTDCDDANAAVHALGNFYADADNDTYGAGSVISICYIEAPAGYSINNTDCDDANAAIHALGNFYVDSDSDAYGAGSVISVCYSGVGAPSGYSINNTDCNDANAAINPSEAEIIGDSIDNDCNGFTDEAFCTGTICATAEEGGTAVLMAPPGALITSITFASYGTPQGTCPDFTYGTCHASSSQSVVESYALNQNSASIPVKNSIFGDPCSGTFKRLYIKAIWTDITGEISFFADVDGDGYGDAAVSIISNGCTTPFGYVSDNSDCYDANSEINPGVSEIINGLDDNCNGIIDDIVCNPPTGLLTKVITATSVKFKWEYSSATYKLRYKEATTESWTLLGPTGQTKTVEGLLSNTKYVWQVKSVCYVDPKITSEWSEKQFFTTAPLRMGDQQVTAIEIYPNPTAEKFILDLRLYSTTNQQASIYLLNALGQVVYSSVESVGKGELKKTITMPSTSAAGWYLVKVVMSDQVIEQKLLYQK